MSIKCERDLFKHQAMKVNKAKPKKILNKHTKKSAQKDLEFKVVDRFTDVIKSLGHDSDKITKEIKKVSKFLSKKLIEKLDGFNDDQEINDNKLKPKDARALNKAQEKAKKIVIKANQKILKEDKTLANSQRHIIPEFSLPAILSNDSNTASS